MMTTKDVVKAQRSRAMGAPGSSPGRSKFKPSQKRTSHTSSNSVPAQEPEQEEERIEEVAMPLRSSVASEGADEPVDDATRARRASYVKKKIESERSKRLRSGQGHMTKSDLNKLKRQFKAEAAAKYAASASSSNGVTAAQTAEMQGKMRLSAEAVQWTPEKDGHTTTQRLEMQRKAREDAKRFLDTHDKENVAHQLQFGAPRVSEGTDPVVADEHEPDDAWWKEEEARWKAELEARRAEEGQDDAGHADEDGTASPDDICLRSQVVTKTESDAGLGIQLFTPPNEQGVRITKIEPDGPFGRTGSFEDGDVIVEIDGTPLLYGGHTAVLAAISSAMQNHAEMVVTVCSPTELAKLEALVDDGDSASSDDTSTARRTQEVPKWLRKDTWTKAFGEMGKMLKPMLTTKPKQNTDGTVGRVKGAPAWWKDGQNPDLAGGTGKRAPSRGQPSNQDAAAATSQVSDGTQPREHYPEPAYLIYRAEIHDLEAYRTEYMDRTTELIQKFGGRWLARGGKVVALEGGDDGETVLQRMVLIEFPSMDAAKNFFRSAEYQEARQARLSIATAELTVLEGMRPQDMPTVGHA